MLSTYAGCLQANITLRSLLRLVGANATCPVTVHNPGNMRIDNVAVFGDSNNCSKALMAPDETLLCSVSRKLAQSEYEQGSFILRAANISGTARGPTVLPALEADVTDSVQPIITQTPQLNVSLVANRTEVYKAGDTVRYTITAVSMKVTFRSPDSPQLLKTMYARCLSQRMPVWQYALLSVPGTCPQAAQ